MTLEEKEKYSKLKQQELFPVFELDNFFKELFKGSNLEEIFDKWLTSQEHTNLILE